MKRWLKIILLVLGVMITAQTQAQAGSRTCSDGLGEPGDRRQTAWSASKERGQALLSNVNELVRLCSQRPERLVSSPAYESVHHGVSRPQHFFNHQKTRFCHYRGISLRLSCPLVDMPQCDYYVYRLRHLLC